MKRNEVEWRKGFRHHNQLDASVVDRELDRIRKDKGRVSPELLVEASKPKESALHDGFEWDNEAAGHKYRCGQARLYITGIVYKPAGAKEPLRKHEIVTHVRNDEGTRETVFAPLTEVLSDKDRAEQLLAECIRYVQQANARLQGIQGQMDHIGRKVKTKAKAASKAIDAFVHEASHT